VRCEGERIGGEWGEVGEEERRREEGRERRGRELKGCV
jgi:hypothetical protein